MIVLIPAYEPDDRLTELISHLMENCGYDIIVVDDGSGQDYFSVFDSVRAMGCTVLTHPVNRGKGRALKTGFEYILHSDEKTGVVTADADGQHSVVDIIRVAEEIPLCPGKIVLGARRFVGGVPLRSIIGNTFNRMLFTAASGNKVHDTQTGLRGIPVSLLPLMLKIEGERFEYEMEMLLEAGSSGYGFRQIFIDTIYLSGNKSSHFRPIRDSVRVCLPFFKFCFSGLTSAVVDYTLLFFLQWLISSVLKLPGALFFGVLLARTASSIVNFTINRTLVFRSRATKQKPEASAFHYYTLVVCLLFVNYLLLKVLTDALHVWLPLGKIIVEFILFFFSYGIQRFVLFKKKPVAI
ncbi:MAG TPA: bifunctional glycosyltransferase family 2/GtrA family protein [Clostridia bacterium]|nr:bifunctional glycosyltransferase family 2/GtrA family protein [Clostridia bacterium]